jgi:hypothetical protein
MKYQSAARWLRRHLARDSVLRTTRPHRRRGVRQNRSMWFVNPSSLPVTACRSCGTAAGYADQKSGHTMARSRYRHGSTSHHRRAVASDRSPTTIPPTGRVSASRAAQTQQARPLSPTNDHNASASITRSPACSRAGRGRAGSAGGTGRGRTPGATTGTGRRSGRWPQAEPRGRHPLDGLLVLVRHRPRAGAATNRRPHPRHRKLGSPVRVGPLRATVVAAQRGHGGGSATGNRSRYRRAGIQAITPPGRGAG